jgi:glycosyltransferase involved in cell wall biosynthesis
VRVVQVCTLERGGPLEQTLALSERLASRGHEVRVVCVNNAIAARFAAVGTRAIVIPFRPGADLRSARRLWPHMRAADVVHAQDRRAGLWTRVAPFPITSALIYTVHGLPDPYLPEPAGRRSPSMRDRLAYEGLDATLCRRTDAVIIPSQALAKTFRTRLRFPARMIWVVPNGVPIPETALERGQEVGTLSLLEPVKDIGTFLRAAAQLVPQWPDLRFVVFGDGSQRDELQRAAADLGLSDRIAFPGFVDRAAALKQLAVLVLPSLVENAPMALLEAMAAGIPAVVSRAGGIPEMVGDDGALLVPPGDVQGFSTAIRRLLADSDLAARVAGAARARVQARFSADANVEATLRIYERALHSRRAL